MSSEEEHPLSVALGKIDPEDLSKTRQDILVEIESSRKDRTLSSFAAVGDKESRTVAKVEVEEAPDSEPSPESEKKDEFVIDLNNLADMLVLLVGRYRRSAKMLIACIALLVISIGLVVKAGFEIGYLQQGQAALQDELKKTTEALAAATEQAKETTEAVKETTEEVKEVREEVKEAAEAAPKIVVDEKTGRAKVVVPVRKHKKSDKEDGEDKPPPPPNAPAPPPPTAKGSQTIPLDPQIGLKGF